jgi:proteasome activator subunit 4
MRVTVSKSLLVFNALVHSLGIRFKPHSIKYFGIFLDAANTGYAEVRRVACVY